MFTEHSRNILEFFRADSRRHRPASLAHRGQGGRHHPVHHLQNCATDAAHYFHAPNNATVADAFNSIANSLSELRLVR